MTLGLSIILITLFGSISNWLNWKFLNFSITRLLYYIGALVHESAHALLCIITGARIREFTVFSTQPQVVHQKSKIPLIGNFLISAAPLYIGLILLFVLNRYVFNTIFSVPPVTDITHIFADAFHILRQINLFDWHSWIMIFLSFNLGAMIGPSFQDLKNMWLVLIILFFVPFSGLVPFTLIALELIIASIMIQLITIIILRPIVWLMGR